MVIQNKVVQSLGYENYGVCQRVAFGASKRDQKHDRRIIV